MTKLDTFILENCINVCGLYHSQDDGVLCLIADHIVDESIMEKCSKRQEVLRSIF